MKVCKLSSLTILIFCSVASAWCWHDLGVFAGLTSSSHDFDKIYRIGATIDAGYKSGYNFGFSADFLKHRSIFTRMSMSFVQKGATIQSIPVTLNPFEKSYRNNLNYFSLSLSEGILINNSRIKPYIIIGVRYDILLSKDIKGVSSIYDNYKTEVFGLSGGIGIKFNRFGLPFFTEILYNHDMTNSGETFSYPEEPVSIKNKSVDLRIGIQF